MTLAVAVDHSPPIVDHTGLILGTPWILAWAFGPVGAPENLTGQTALLYVGDALFTPTVDGPNGLVSISYSAAQTALFQFTSREYVLLLQGSPQVRGTLYTIGRIDP